MLYILASEFNKRLYHHVTSKGMAAQYVTTLDHLTLYENDTLIADVLCHETEVMSIYETHKTKYIVMSDENGAHENLKFISKYQPIESICNLLFEQQNQLITIIGCKSLFEKIMLEYPLYKYIDFSYTPDSNLSLIQILDEYEGDFLNNTRISKENILYPIANIMDLLDPPVKLITPLLEKLRMKNNTIIHIDHLKGPLDLMLLNQSDLVIIVHTKIESRSKWIDNSIEKILSPKKLISLYTSTKAFEQFNLSNHIFCDKEFL